nr:hypothetical protein [Akkermansia muciniphila]
MANLKQACADLKADAANDQTTLAERAPFVEKIASLNNKIIKPAVDNSDNYYLTDTLVGFDYDSAFGTLIRKLLPGTGWTWFVLAALFGAVVSSLASMLNSASTIFTMDIYNKLRKNAGPTELVTVGKIGLLVCAVIALTIAPFLDSPAFGGIFNFIQEFQGFLSPGALCVFLFGFFVPKCPRIFGWLGIVINALLYGILKVWQPEMAFLNRMAVCFITVVVIGFIFTAVNAAAADSLSCCPTGAWLPFSPLLGLKSSDGSWLPRRSPCTSSSGNPGKTSSPVFSILPVQAGRIFHVRNRPCSWRG